MPIEAARSKSRRYYSGNEPITDAVSISTIRVDPLRRVVGAFAEVIEQFRLPFAITALLGAIDIVWSRAAGVTFTGHAMYGDIAIVVGIGLIWQVASTLMLQRPGASTLPLQLMRFGRATSFFGLWGGVALAMALLSYLGTRLALPFWDVEIHQFDRSLGFDWPGWTAYVAGRPWLARPLAFAYTTHAPQTGLVFLVTAFCIDRRRVPEFFWTALISGVACCVISAVVPAIGVRVLLHIGTGNWVHDVLLLRQPAAVSFDISKLNGLVSLPSYHTVLAVLFTWSTRRTGIIGWTTVVLNAVMIVSTLNEGGHYLADVLAGIALAVATIAVVHRRLYRDLKLA